MQPHQDDQDRRGAGGTLTVIASCATAAIAVLLLLVCAIALLILLGPAIGNVFTQQLAVQECSFSSMVIVFDDANQNQIRDSGEAGLEGVTVSLTVDQQANAVVEKTDAEGIAKVEWYNAACKTTRRFIVAVDSPPSWYGTTQQTFGPYDVTFYFSTPPLYVGMTRSQ